MRRRLFSVIAVALLFGGTALAQETAAPPSPVMTTDSERVFGTSEIGRKITGELEAELEGLVAENRQIEADLTAEEQSLTTKRSQMQPTEFRALADEFDARVQRIRAEQDAKQRALQAKREAERQNFIDVIAPILTSIGRERGAIVILERRSVVLSADSADITDEVIARINATLAEGADPGSLAPEAPAAAPATGETPTSE